ncbi:TetR/AcrR family transcriptional regulator [Methylocapsa acidiphila]|uniref:TetR/AcrR family transcriptional regulator n=1 Tax=Methylocapsa acidiphila TaxID=133552 RepID=UPI0009FD4CB9|nr:TetR/AcrR family transcriptional regulator [Methylocapsa acidiphila]
MVIDVRRTDDIVSVAASLFRAKGYHATSMSDVAEACRIQKPSLYYHFASKEDLAIAVMKRTQEFFDSHIFIYAYDESLSSQSRLLKLNKALEQYFSIKDSGCVFANFAIETMESIPDFSDPIRHYFNCWSKAYQAIFHKLYKKDELEALADGFVSDLQGALIMMRVTGKDAPLRRLSARLLEASHFDASAKKKASLKLSV